MSGNLKYKCVNCGNSVQELYRRYSPTVLKLMECVHCQEVADRYIEYDLVIIMIDLVLLNKQAYRHILYNSPFKNHWKLAVVLLLTETYSEWASHRTIQSSSYGKTKERRSNDLFEGERSFYFICLQSIIGSTMFIMFVFTVTFLRWVAWPQTKPSSFSFMILWKALVLSSFGKFLLVPGLVWGVNSSEIHTLFITGYTFLSQLQVYSVVSDTSRLSAGAIILLGLAAKYFTRQLLSDLRLDQLF